MKHLLLTIWKHLIPESLKPRISVRLNRRFSVGVVGVFFDEAGRVLLFHHTYRSKPWGVPTGWMETNEQPAQGLLREVAEESGLKVEIYKIHRVDVDGSRMDIIMAGRFVGGAFTASPEVKDYGLFSLDKLPHNIHPPQSALVREVWEDLRELSEKSAGR